MKPVYPVFKPTSITPLEMVRALKLAIPDLTNTPVGYAGRLDPMADGLLLLLAGDENKKKSAYEQLSKTYTVKIVFGYATDTYDCMGLVTDVNNSQVTKDQVTQALDSFIGTFSQQYPPYSSKTIAGVPLYRLARNNEVPTGEVPVKNVTISKVTCLSFGTIKKSDFSRDIFARISRVKGNFRQKDIISRWKNVLKDPSVSSLSMATAEIAASSGTYMRSIAHTLGTKVHVPAVAYTITRTAIGDYTLKDAMRLLI